MDNLKYIEFRIIYNRRPFYIFDFFPFPVTF